MLFPKLAVLRSFWFLALVPALAEYRAIGKPGLASNGVSSRKTVPVQILFGAAIF